MYWRLAIFSIYDNIAGDRMRTPSPRPYRCVYVRVYDYAINCLIKLQ